MPVSDVGSTVIPLLVGHLMNSMFHGAFLVQVYIYFVSFPRDRRTLKLLVLVMFILENVQTGIDIFDALTSFGTNFGNVDEVERVRLQWLSVPVLSAPISCTVQIFYAYRVSILARSRLKAAVLVLLSITQGVASLVAGIPVAFMKEVTITSLRGLRFTPVIIWTSTTFLCDVSIAGSMNYYLRREGSSVNTSNTRFLLQRIKRNTLETGGITAGVATAALVLWIAVKQHPIWVVYTSIITKIYSNSLLANLNSRLELRVVDEDHPDGRDVHSPWQVAAPTNSSPGHEAAAENPNLEAHQGRSAPTLSEETLLGPRRLGRSGTRYDLSSVGVWAQETTGGGTSQAVEELPMIPLIPLIDLDERFAAFGAVPVESDRKEADVHIGTVHSV